MIITKCSKISSNFKKKCTLFSLIFVQSCARQGSFFSTSRKPQKLILGKICENKVHINYYVRLPVKTEKIWHFKYSFAQITSMSPSLKGHELLQNTGLCSSPTVGLKKKNQSSAFDSDHWSASIQSKTQSTTIDLINQSLMN